ncbi:hypothetical protein BDZ89DRAFT_1134026 [Hymenopellis radicata]|nr:hypothetical protein BDZ89DRAFT_1134026 [Hymenopellis radicata]
MLLFVPTTTSHIDKVHHAQPVAITHGVQSLAQLCSVGLRSTLRLGRSQPYGRRRQSTSRVNAEEDVDAESEEDSEERREDDDAYEEDESYDDDDTASAVDDVSLANC